MAIQLVEVAHADRDLLVELLDSYLCELAGNRDVAHGATCAAEYPYLDAYFAEAGRHALFIHHQGRPSGFALVRGPQSTGSTWQFAELYVASASRRQGVGRDAVLAVWKRFAGDWELQVHARNAQALEFWMSCVATATQRLPHKRQIQASDGKRIQLSFHVAP